MKSDSIDFQSAQKFLDLLDNTTDQFTFQTFDDDNKRKGSRLVRVLHGTLEEHFDELSRLNSHGAGVFVTVNATNLNGRTKGDITKVRAVWQEDDNKEENVPLLPLVPHMIVRSSERKYHRYILVNEDENAFGQFSSVMRSMVRNYASDPNAADLSRVLRVPGFYHNKQEPQIVELIHESGEDPYEWSEVYKTFVLDHPEEDHQISMSASDHVHPNRSTDDLQGALNVIPCQDLEYSDWVRIGMALHHEFDGDEAGLSLWDEWSQQDEERYKGDCHIKWDSFGGNRQSPVTVATIYYHAREYGYTPSVLSQVYSENDRPTTDVGNAERIVDLHQGRLKYLKDENEFRYYVDGKWRRIDGFEIAKMTVRTISAEAYHCTDDRKRTELNRHAWYSEKRSSMVSALDLVKSEPAIYCYSNSFDQDPNLLGVANGLVDIRTGSLVQPQQKHMIRKELGCELKEGLWAPKWEKFIDEVCEGSKELAAFLQRMAGYMLHDGNPEQKVFIFHGRGGNGKSTYVDVLEKVLNDYSVTSPPSTLMEVAFGRTGGGARSDVVRLKDARAVFSQESQQGDFLDVAFIKMASGGDTIVARNPYEKEQEFKPKFKLLLSTNHKPIIRETTEAVWSRLVTVPLKHDFRKDPNRIYDLDKILIKEELIGILNWVLEGHQMWRKEGLNLPSEVLQDLQIYRSDQDIFGQWVEDCCTEDHDHHELTKDLYGSYRNWCTEDQGMKPWTQKSFVMQLDERGFRQHRTKAGRGWKGLKLNDQYSKVVGDF